MPSPDTGSMSAAPVVAAVGDQNKHKALRRLMGEKKMLRGEAMEGVIAVGSASPLTAVTKRKTARTRKRR